MKIRDRIKEVRKVRAGDLLPNPRNWRTHPQNQRDALKGVLAEIGMADVLLAYETPSGLMLIDGHARAEVSPDTEWTVCVLDVDDREAATILATLDPLAAMAGADAAALDELLRDVNTGSAAVQEMLSKLANEAGLYQDETKADIDAEPQIDIAEELRVKWGVETGQLWGLGEHRLLCGDSANQDDMNRIMGGDRACCVFTDPPYGVSIGKKNTMLNSFQKAGRNLTDIKDDDATPDELKARLVPAFTNIKNIVMSDDCTVFVTAPQGGQLSMMMMMMEESGLPIRHVLIWKKNSPTFSMGRLDYDYQHEPILLTWGKRHKRPMKGNHRTSVWEIDKPRSSKEHPTMKPVDLVVNAYLNNSDSGDITFDAYCGSGTSIIAAEQTGRKCRAIEISPGYVAVALQRWADATGGTPCLI